MPTTPNYAIPYQSLADAPDGPNLGEDGFLAVDTALAAMSTRVDALEALGLDDAWVAWTPGLTNLTLGNGTVTAKRRLIGKTLNWRFKFVLGSTSAVGTDPQFTLSHTPHADYAQFDVLGHGSLLDAGVASADSMGRFNGGSTVVIMHSGATNLHTSITAVVPWTWATGDMLTLMGTIEVA